MIQKRKKGKEEKKLDKNNELNIVLQLELEEKKMALLRD